MVITNTTKQVFIVFGNNGLCLKLSGTTDIPTVFTNHIVNDLAVRLSTVLWMLCFVNTNYIQFQVIIILTLFLEGSRTGKL